jgi:hypothetical protein
MRKYATDPSLWRRIRETAPGGGRRRFAMEDATRRRRAACGGVGCVSIGSYRIRPIFREVVTGIVMAA